MREYDQFAQFYDLMYQWNKDDIPFYVKEAKKSGGKVLEIACGTGRITVPIAKAGVDITGIDYSKEMLDNLKRKIKDLKNKPKIKQADMRTFKLRDKFNLIIVPFRAFLHMKTQEDQLKALMNFRKHLKKGGRLILNFFFPSYDWMVRRHDKNIRQEQQDFKNPKTGNKVQVWIHPKYDMVNQRIDVEDIFKEVKGKKSVKTWKIPYSLRYIWKNEFELMLKLVGFKSWKVYGGFKKKKLTPKEEQVWIIQN
jgi:ubiquinone/menaquinone biosynthesis C-methylase UbiE